MKLPFFLRSRAFFVLIGIITLLLFLGCSCGKSVENNTISSHCGSASTQKDSTDTNHDRVRTMGTYALDSVYNSDSVVVVVINDTVLRDRWHFRTKIKTKLVYLTDTMVIKRDLYHYKTDTLKLYITKTKYKEVEKKLSTWEHIKNMFGGYSIIAICLLIIYMYFRRKR